MTVHKWREGLCQMGHFNIVYYVNNIIIIVYHIIYYNDEIVNLFVNCSSKISIVIITFVHWKSMDVDEYKLKQ